MDLPEDSSCSFELFLPWLYGWNMNDDGTEIYTDYKLYTDTLIDLYLFADAKFCRDSRTQPSTAFKMVFTMKT